jgi:iron complex outermembrane receptor protein
MPGFNRISLRAMALGGCAAIAFAHVAVAQEAAKPVFEIAAGDLRSALQQFARQTNQEVMFSNAVVEGKRTRGFSGADDAPDALHALLADTGLTFTKTATGTLLVVSEGGSPQGASAAGGGAEVEALIVTAQKKNENIQDVPIAISAFTQKSLDEQKIEGGFDLLKGVPNVAFSKTNFSGYNFSIRGIGTQAISATTDPAVAVSFNNTTLIVNRLFEQEYVDVERVEVLRGPQGTLYGRNATSGVINVISAKPVMGEFLGEAKLEGGNFNAQRFRGHINVPIGETLAVRGAYAMTKRDGYGFNEFDGSDVDNRDLWTGRITAAWEPNERFRSYVLWERFEEDDERVRTSKQLCHRDPSKTEVGGVSLAGMNTYARTLLSQGCVAGSLYAPGAFGTVNGESLPYVTGLTIAIDFGDFFRNDAGAGKNPYGPHFTGFGLSPASEAPCAAAAAANWGYLHDICNPDPYRGRMQSTDLRSISSEIKPKYEASSDIYELAFDFDVSESLTLSSQTVYSTDEVWATQDYNRFAAESFWADARENCGSIGPDIFNKYVANCSDEPVVMDGVTYLPEDYGRGTFAPLQDVNGDGFIDQTSQPLHAGEVVDADGWVRDQDGRRVGWFSHFFPGEFCDPQLGCSSNLLVQDLSRAKSKQFNQEFRLVSNFDAPVNFSLGANYTKFETFNDYFVFSNAFTALLHTGPFNSPTGFNPDTGAARSSFNVIRNTQRDACLVYQEDDDVSMCRYVDPNPIESINGDGHNYFRSANPYELTSTGLFGELYWNLTETLKLTAGARMTWDQKVFTPIPSQLLLADYRDLSNVGEGSPPPNGEDCGRFAQNGCPFTGNAPNGRGSPANPDIIQSWREPTGRLVLDWKPDLGLSWVNEAMFYVSLAHGYKGGGANPPSVAPPSGNLLTRASGGAAPPTFEPEFIDAFEVGTKSTLLGGALTLNATSFYYDYKDYQISKILDRSAANENFDAEVWGAELEGMFAATRSLRFNFAFGYLDTKVGKGEASVDLMDRTDGGNTSWETPHGYAWNGFTVVKPWVVAASNCVVPTEFLMGAAHAALTPGETSIDILAMCPAGGVQGGTVAFGGQVVPYIDQDGVFWSARSNCNPATQNCSTRTYDVRTDAPNGASGFSKDVGGNELPNAPHWTASVGAQYTLELPGGWDATLRGDFYWQSQSFARIYNTQYDKLRAWTNTNVSLWFENRDWDVKAEIYVKNAFDETPITGAFLNSDDTGLTTNVFTLDPRLIGVSVTKSF